MESHEDRLKRFQDGPPSEVILTLTNSINNYFNPEIAGAATAGSWSLMFMGTHAVALTVSQALFGLTGKDGYLRFLRTFMDQDSPGADFSAIGPRYIGGETSWHTSGCRQPATPSPSISIWMSGGRDATILSSSTRPGITNHMAEHLIQLRTSGVRRQSSHLTRWRQPKFD